MVADAGGNDVLGVKHKQITTLAMFPNTLVPRPAVHPAAPAGRDDPDAGGADECRDAAA